MLEKFNDYEKQLLDDTKEKLGCFYPNSKQLEKYLMSESLTGNSHSTLATFSLSNYNITLPITTRKYHNRIVSQLYHSEFFKTQYSKIIDIHKIVDMRSAHTQWKPIVIPNDILIKYLSTNEINHFKQGDTGIFSITVFAEKPLVENNAACTPGGSCC